MKSIALRSSVSVTPRLFPYLETIYKHLPPQIKIKIFHQRRACKTNGYKTRDQRSPSLPSPPRPFGPPPPPVARILNAPRFFESEGKLAPQQPAFRSSKGKLARQQPAFRFSRASLPAKNRFTFSSRAS